MRGRMQMIAGQETGAGAEKKRAGPIAGSNEMEEKSSVKVGTRLKQKRSGYKNVEEMLREKREKEGGEEEREEEEISGRSKKTSRLPIRKMEEGKDMGEKEATGLREELKEMFRIQK